MSKQNNDKVYLVDGSAYIFRAFHALPPMSRTDGTPVNAVFGFTKMLAKLIEDSKAKYLAVIFDTSKKTFRTEIYPQYKANRPPPPDELIPQFNLIREATRAYSLPCLEMEGFEADDLIATYTNLAIEQGFEVTIVSSDKDLMQLIQNGVQMLDPMKNRSIGVNEVVEKFGVGPEKVIEAQALAGDSADNVPGVPGIGVKTAAQLLQEYGDLETLLKRAPEIKQPKRRQALLDNAVLARISRELVTLKQDVPVNFNISDFRIIEPDLEVLIPFLEKQGFRSIVSEVRSKFGVNNGGDLEDIEQKFDEISYELVQDEEALRAWVSEIKQEGIVAFDTETNSLRPMEADLVGFSMSVVGGKACYVPIAHVLGSKSDGRELELARVGSTDLIEPKQIPLQTALDIVKPILEDLGILKIGHNIKYDFQVMSRYGINVQPVDDTMLLSYVLDGGTNGHGLDELTMKHLDHVNIKYKEVTGTGKGQICFSEVALDKAVEYAAEDADMTRRLYRKLKPRLVEEKMVGVYETIERRLLPILSGMERAGISVDAVFLKSLSQDFERRAKNIALEIFEISGHQFNIGSPKQLGDVLFSQMGFEGGKKTKTGAYGTGADVLENLAAQGHELPQKVLEWRQLSKLRSTYTDALINQINPSTNRVHTSYAQAVASTGRLSSSDPNLQNIPIRTEEGRKIRRAFVAPSKHVLMSADYSQIELRLLAHVAAIDPLKSAFHEGQDIHAMTASEVFDIPIDNMTASERNRAKAINFGIIYGISAFGLARQLRIPQNDAKQYIKNYLNKFPGIVHYMESTKEFARQNGFVKTIFGRKCHTPGISDKNPTRRNFSERAAINAPLQGAAADIIKRAMIKMPSAIKDAGLRGKMLLQVHDELIFEVPGEEIAEMEKVVAGVMAGAADLDVPLVIDIGYGANWDQAH